MYVVSVPVKVFNGKFHYPGVIPKVHIFAFLDYTDHKVDNLYYQYLVLSIRFIIMYFVRGTDIF